jgi:hypothetical protein
MKQKRSWTWLWVIYRHRKIESNWLRLSRPKMKFGALDSVSAMLRSFPATCDILKSNLMRRILKRCILAGNSAKSWTWLWVIYRHRKIESNWLRLSRPKMKFVGIWYFIAGMGGPKSRKKSNLMRRILKRCILAGNSAKSFVLSNGTKGLWSVSNLNLVPIK